MQKLNGSGAFVAAVAALIMIAMMAASWYAGRYIVFRH